MIAANTMQSALRSALAALVLSAPIGVFGQDLPPALARQFTQGVEALKAGQLDRAEAAFRDVLARGGDRAFVHHNLGIVHQQRNHHVGALAEFRAAARLDPAFGPARLLAGSSLLALGRAGEAVTELERAVRLLPGEKAARLQLADACERVGNVPCLARQSRVLAGFAPSDPEYTYRLGKAYLRLSEWSYKRILAIDPRSARLSEALGREYLQQDALGWDDAAREVERELAAAPGSAAALELKARVDAARAMR